MNRSLLAWCALGALAVACGEENSADAPFVMGGGAAGNNMSATSPVGSDGAPTTGTPGTGGDDQEQTPTDDGADPFNIGVSGGEDEGGADASVDLPEFVTPKVACGSSQCETVDGFVCCDTYDGSNYEAPACKAVATCDQRELDFLLNISIWQVTSECDGPEDCGLEQVCCFMNQGPGAAPLGRECKSLNECNGGSIGLGRGLPAGLYSCNQDADCLNGQTCRQETMSSEAPGRSYVKVCG